MICGQGTAASLAAAVRTAYLSSMNTTKKDIDPSTEFTEEDEEQALPEPETGIDLAAAGGSLPAGRVSDTRRRARRNKRTSEH